jgi:CheY-like chemotaxis protein
MTTCQPRETYCDLCHSVQSYFVEIQQGLPIRRCRSCGFPVGEDPLATAQTQGKSILCVDDSLLFRTMIADLLTGAGYIVRQAETGPAGIASAKRERPDTILLDVVMPEMDGFTTCGLMKADPDLADIPIVILTQVNDPALNERAFRAGALLALHKMARPETVLLTVANAVAMQTVEKG